MKVVIGLGNPGRAYEGTRHNVGFRVVETLAARHGGRFRRSWRHALRSGEIRGEACGTLLLVEPLGYMNRSGDAVAPFVRKRGAGAADLVAVYDEAALDLGVLRIRAGGSAAGHNGVRSLIERLGTDAFVRVRVGVGPAPRGCDLARYVLGRFRAGEREQVDAVVERAADAVCSVAVSGVEAAMNRFNGSNGPGEGRG